MLVLWAKQKCSDVFGQTHLPGQSEIRPTCDLLASALLWGQAYGTFPQSVNHHMSLFSSAPYQRFLEREVVTSPGF